ncbi:unnamed protein product [Prorocentrum cordatum]|uniref:RanBP2-type domain-containing protein n=1 Tax=Prorocentrum cordatum TaxID=2364126 RepID=A0ABN9V1I0_9DINO|nr:unnamed protein product [Polarella glacialis]
MARPSRGGGSGGRRSRTYWMCSCGGWNWDWRTTCIGCGYAAPPWALGAAAKAQPQADKDGWVDQPRGRCAQRQARSAATSASTSKSQTSASGASGTPSGSGATAIERLQVAVEQLEAPQAEPPDGVDCCFTDVVASQLEAKRAELAEAQRAAAEQKASSMPLSTMPHKEANATSKAEKRLRAARQSLEQKQEARRLVEAQLQKAQEELAQLDAEVEEASRALHALEEEARVEAAAQLRQRAAEWAGASQVPGLFMQLDELPEAWGSSNFEVAWAAIRSQVEAVRAQLAEAPSCHVGEISSEGGDHAGGCRPWQPQCAAERGQAERRGGARGEWPTVAQACKRELAAEAEDLAPLAARPARRAAGSRGGGERPQLACAQQEGGGAEPARFGAARPLDLGSAQAPPAPGHAGTAAQDDRCGLEEYGANGNAWWWSLEGAEASGARSGAPPRLVGHQGARLASHRLEEARGAARRMGSTAFLHASAPTDKEGQLANSGGVAGWRLGWCGVTASGLRLLACSLGPKGFDLDSLAAFGDAVLYQRPRFIPVVGLATGTFRTNGAGLAGCASGLTVAKPPGRAALRAAPAGDRPLGVACYDDGDIALQAVGTGQLVAAWFGRAGLEVARRLRGQHLPLSAAKTSFLAPSPCPGRQLGACGKSQGWALGETLQARNLGWDPAGPRLGPFHEAGPAASRVSGRTVTGNADCELHGWLTRAWIDWHFKSERYMVADLGVELDLMHHGPLELGWEAGPGARSASLRHETRKFSLDTYLLGACISNPRWTQARLLDAREQGQTRCCCRGPSDEKLDGKLYLDGATLEPLFGSLCWEGGAIEHRDGDGNLVAEVYGAVGSDRCPQRAAKDGEDVAAWMLATLARPAVEGVSIDCSWHAVLDGRLAEAQRRGDERADRLAVRMAQMHAVGKVTVGGCQAQAGFVQVLGRWIWCAVILGQGIEARDGEGLPHAAERRQARVADAERSQAAEGAKGGGPSAERPRLESARSTGNSSAALSASAVAFSILGHALSYACAGDGEGTQELVACSKCGAYMTLGGRSGVKPRLKERCPGDETDRDGRNQRSLWLRGLHPGGRPPKRRPAAASVENLGEFGVADVGIAAAAGSEGGALEGRRVRRRVAHRGGLSVAG